MFKVPHAAFDARSKWPATRKPTSKCVSDHTDTSYGLSGVSHQYVRKQWVSCFPSQGFMFSHLGFHVFPRRVSCFPLLRKFNVSMLTKRRHNRLRTCQAHALCVGFNVTSHCGAQWFEPEACANVARNRPPFSRQLVLLHRAAR